MAIARGAGIALGEHNHAPSVRRSIGKANPIALGLDDRDAARPACRSPDAIRTPLPVRTLWLILFVADARLRSFAKAGLLLRPFVW